MEHQQYAFEIEWAWGIGRNDCKVSLSNSSDPRLFFPTYPPGSQHPHLRPLNRRSDVSRGNVMVYILLRTTAILPNRCQIQLQLSLAI